MKKSVQSDYYDIVKARLENFAANLGISTPSFQTDTDTDESRAVLCFDGFEATVYFGDMMPYGYTFLEDVQDVIAEYCLLTRFKFNFSKTHFSPYDIHNVIGCTDFRTLDFHLIRDENSLRKSLDTILSFIESNNKAISDIGYDLNLQNKLTRNYENDMTVVSPKITELNLKDDFRKYTEKHESRLHSFGDAVSMIRFVNCGKSDAIKRYFKRAERKGRLLTFEQRYRDYLEKTGYQVPLGDFAYEVKAQTKRSKKSTLINIASAILAAVAAVFLLALIEVIVDEKIGYTVISAYYGMQFIFFGVMVSFWHIFSTLISKIFLGESFSSQKSRATNKTVSIVLLVVELAVIIGCGTYYYCSGYKPVALTDKGIYYGSVNDNEILPFDTDRIEFYYINGYVDYYEETIVEDEENAAIYIVVDGNFADYGIDGIETVEERRKVLEKMKEKGVKIEYITTYKQYDELFVSQ